ncbi:MAG: hypothetical protein Q8L72_01950 [Moraxellaceae bacterium]|nr:hypothetical protein [Moraxellaceae bacterium]
MSLISLSLCGILLQPSLTPAPMLEQVYEDTYGCLLEVAEASPKAINPNQLYRYFPGDSKYWPVFTADHIPSKAFDSYIDSNVKPGIVIPLSSTKNFSFSTYKAFRSAVKRGAIVIVQGQTANQSELYSAATFALAVGLRPQLFLKNNHLEDSFLTYESGSYLFNNESNTLHLPVPNGLHIVQEKTVIPLSSTKNYGSGLQAIVNPSFDPQIVESIEYPPLGVEWTYAGSHFISSPEGLKTGPMGHAWTLITLIAVPIGVFLAGDLPNFFAMGATTISYVSVVFGSLLIGLFIIAIIRSRRS